jgi:hypothetical protein
MVWTEKEATACDWLVQKVCDLPLAGQTDRGVTIGWLWLPDRCAPPRPCSGETRGARRTPAGSRGRGWRRGPAATATPALASPALPAPPAT